MNEQKPDISSSFQVLFIVWASLAFSQLLLFITVWLIKPELFRFDLSQPLLGRNSALILAAALISVIALLMSIFLSSKYVKLSIEKQRIEFVQTGMIMGIALAESVTLLGLFLAFAVDYQYFFIWMIVGLAATVLHFPRRQQLLDATSGAPPIR